MNDFPSMEDRAAGTAAEDFGSTSRSDGTNRMNGNFTGTGVPSASVQNQPIRRIMNRQNHQHEVIVSGIHLELTPSLKTFVREKVERLFRHEERIVRLRVELECDAKEEVGTRFKAKGHVVIQGPDMNAMVQADECHKAVALLVDKLDRMLSRRAQLYRVRRHNLHPVEIEAELP
jgi:putative sigma-54 modulation protein